MNNSAAFDFGVKLALLDLSKLPKGVTQPDEYTLRWRTPGGHSIEHDVNPGTTAHGAAVGDPYYRDLDAAILSRSTQAGIDAPKDIADDVKLRRGGKALLGGIVGGVGGRLLGSHWGASGKFVGTLGGGLLGASIGATRPTPPLKHKSYYLALDDLHGIPGGHIPQLYSEMAEDKQLREAEGYDDLVDFPDASAAYQKFYGYNDPTSPHYHGYNR